MCSHLQLLVKHLSPALGLLQGLAGRLSIAHEHTVGCSCLLEVTSQDLIHFCQQIEGTDKMH